MSELVCRTLELLAESKGTFASAVKNIFNTRTIISDLSVGDWVMVEWPDGERWRGRLTRLSVTGGVEVCCANDKHVRCSSDFISSIPITAEILENNGFKKVEPQWCMCEINGIHISIIVWGNQRGRIEISYKSPFDDDNPLYIADFTANIPHIAVHHLQRVLRLAGVEKEIVW